MQTSDPTERGAVAGYTSPNETSSSPGEKVSRSNAFDRWLLRRMWQLIGAPSIRLELWDGFGLGDAEHGTKVVFHDRGAFYRGFYKPTYTFGVLFSANRVSVRGDLITAMEDIYRGLDAVEKAQGPAARLAGIIGAKRPRPNSMRRAKDNIHAHYDLGNDFYGLWLDEPYRQYTCAYYADPAYTLEQAQVAKLEYVCRKLALKPGETVVEAGSGWGGLARYLARHYGVKVRSYNISPSQVAYAQARAAEENLSDSIEYIEDDARNVTGSYDAYVSVGMLEHVGPDNYRNLGASIDRCLKDDGRGFIHSIGQISPRPLNEWIERTIFPGGRPGSIAQMTEIFEPQNLIVTDIENLAPHYARTLHHWYERFERHRDEVEEMFDESFARTWQLYLAGSAAAFSAGNLQLFQIVFRRSACAALPETRDALYAPGLTAGLPPG